MFVLFCLQIFMCRVLDVSLGTMRTILVVRGKTLFAAGVGLVEAFLWFVVVRIALDSEHSGIIVAIAYAGGFATGTYCGGLLADRYLKGALNLQVVTRTKNDEMVEAIRAAGFAVTVLNVNSSQFSSEKYMLIIEIKSDSLKKLEKIIYSYDEGAFIMAKETKFISNGFVK